MIRKTSSILLIIGLIVISISGCTEEKNPSSEKLNGQEDQRTVAANEEEIEEEHQQDNVDGDLAGQEISFINATGNTLETRIQTPEGYTRIEATDNSFGDYLRNFTLKEDGSPVLLYDGREKGNQSAHITVFDMRLSNKDLQQCADSIIRMYAEYYYANKQYDKIKFHFVSGFLCEYEKWQNGYRVKVDGNNVSWQKTKGYDDSYETFEKYLDTVFSYASTLSLDKESSKIDIADLQIGDIFLKGGSPGHVVMVVDICENQLGEKAFLLAQGFMPAQEFHVLNNPSSESDPWYYVNEVKYPFRTSEYSFDEGSLKRLEY
ncbi:MAG: DUF4846 domain-containing protein [Clostridiales bacterium]|nr:DUF4846 domain-containing protein [Clostridiales bacterium]